MESRGLFIQMAWHIMDLLIKQRIPTEIFSPCDVNYRPGCHYIGQDGDVKYDMPDNYNVTDSYGILSGS